jgi:alkylhydroperoxidase/carboxymuconolactone decarboxylase family protein YurZ
MTERDLPAGASRIAERHAAVWQAYERLGAACSEAGPVDGRARRLVKLALAIGAASEGAVHSHVRRALAEGAAIEELEHVALLAIPTLGFPQAVAALTWIEDITKPASEAGRVSP